MKFLLFLLVALSIQASEIKFLSWNVFMIPKPIFFSHQIKRAELIADELNREEFDFVALQEAFSGLARRKISKLTQEKYPYSFYSKKHKGGSKTGVLASGLFFLSKYPIKTLEIYLYKNCTTSDCFSDKAFILHEIDLGERGKIQVGHTHMQAWNTDKARTVRQAQLKEIKSVLAKHQQDKVPQLIMGDFNVDYYKFEEYQQMLSILETDSIPQIGSLTISNGYPVDCYKIPGYEEGGEWLDHFFFYPNNSNVVAKSSEIVSYQGMIKNQKCDLSDHYALKGLLEL